MHSAELAQHLQALVALAFIVLAPLPLGLAFAFAHTAGRPAPLSHFAVIVGIAWLTVQTFLGLILGLLGRLTLGHVVFVESIIVSFGVMAIVRCGKTFPRPIAARRELSLAEAAIIACVATVAVWLLHQTATTPLTEYDSLAYHLPAVANWYRTARLDMLGQGSVDYYPFNFELVALLFVLPFHGHFAIGLAQMLAWLLFGLAIYATATLLGARPLHGLVAALLVLIQPLVLRLTTTTLQVDLAFAAAFLTTLYAALTYVLRGSHWSLIVLSGAWLAGTKTSGLGYLGLIALTILFARKTFARQGARSTVVEAREPSRVVVLLSLVASLANVGFWYGRNLLSTGNPLGLVGLTAFGFPILDGPIKASELSRSSLAAVFRLADRGDWLIVLKQFAVHFGAPFALLVVATVLLVAVPSPTTPPWRDRVARLVLGLLVLCAVAYIFTPFSGDDVGTYGWRVTPWIGQALRYALPAVGVLGVAAALGMTRVGRFDAALAVVATSAGLLSLPHHRLLALPVWGAMWWYILRRQRLPRWSRLVVIYGCALILIASSPFLREIKDTAYARMFPVVSYIDRYVGHGEKIGLLVTNRASVFFGTRFTADVAFVPYGEVDASQWVRTLRSRQFHFIGVGPILEEWWLSSNELTWLDRDHESFEKVYGTDYRGGSVLYRLRESNQASLIKSAPP